MMMPFDEFAKRLFITFPGLINEIDIATVVILVNKHFYSPCLSRCLTPSGSRSLKGICTTGLRCRTVRDLFQGVEAYCRHLQRPGVPHMRHFCTTMDCHCGQLWWWRLPTIKGVCTRRSIEITMVVRD